MGSTVFPAAASGPTLAEITTAIQTNAAPASVTNSSIATQVTNNASQFNGTWTYLGYVAGNGGVSASFTGLSGYKRYRVYFNQANTAGHNLWFRINGDTGSNYTHFSWASRSGNTAVATKSMQDSMPTINANSIAASNAYGGYIDFDFANSTSTWKSWNGRIGYTDGGATSNTWGESTGFWYSNAAITGIEMRASSGTWNQSGSPWGFTLYGAN